MRRGCLVIHGLTGTPATVASLQDALLAKGYRVSSPCLAGHGGSFDELEASTWREWYETVKIAFQNLRKDVDRIYYAGLSLGALLGLKLALDEGWGIRALALLGTPLKLSVLNRGLIFLVKNTPARLIVRRVPKDIRKSVADPEGQRLYEQFSQHFIPTKSVFEVTNLQRLLINELYKLSNPLLLLHAKNDFIAPIFNVSLVKGLVASDVIETVEFAHSKHVLTMDAEKEEVSTAVVDFFNKFA